MKEVTRVMGQSMSNLKTQMSNECQMSEPKFQTFNLIEVHFEF